MITTCIMIKEVHPVISYIRGPLEEKREDSVVVEAGDIGGDSRLPDLFSVVGSRGTAGTWGGSKDLYLFFCARGRNEPLWISLETGS